MKNDFIVIPKNDEEKIFQRKLNVCAYCRVSVKSEDSSESLNNQRQFFEKEVKRFENWVLKEIFFDYGISGTSRKNRDGFNEMLKRTEEGEYDLIMTKEVSRFSRNLIDTLMIARELRSKGVYIWFVNDFINTQYERDMDALVDIARQAQRESERTSKRVQWGHRQKMEQGVVFGRSLLGYSVKNGELNIDESEAETVRRIFNMYIEGCGSCAIANTLSMEGKKITPSGILKILKNEKYAGDLLQQKTYTIDPLSHKKKQNKGEKDKIFIKNHHEPVIDRDTWEKTQEILSRRREIYGKKRKFNLVR